MKIEHTLKRTGGTEIPMPPTGKSPAGKVYHFKPEEGSTAHVADVSDSVHLKSFLSTEGFELAEEDDGDDVGTSDGADAEGGGEAGGAAPADVPLEDADLDQLRAIYQAELGEEPRGNAGADLLRSRIEAHREEDAATKPDTEKAD